MTQKIAANRFRNGWNSIENEKLEFDRSFQWNCFYFQLLSEKLIIVFDVAKINMNSNDE